MKAKWIMAFIAAFFAQYISSPTARAAAPTDQNTVQDLYSKCTSPDVRENVLCIQYILGAGAVMSVVGTARSDPQLGICTPIGATGGAMKQAFENWAAKHPETWTEGQIVGLMISLRETWPCHPSAK